MSRRTQIIQVIDHIDRHLEDRITLDELARVSCFSKPQFCRLFIKYTDFTPMNYVNHRKLNAAAKELEDNHNKILDIAMKYSFESHDVFIRAFKREYGVTPSEYRNGKSKVIVQHKVLSSDIYFILVRRRLMQQNVAMKWGQIATDYALYREIFPDSYYEKLHNFGLGNAEQHILDLCTGTGVLPRNMYAYGGHFTGIDISKGMIETAKRLTDNDMIIDFQVADANHLPFQDQSFDVVTAQQCWVYLDKSLAIPEIERVLRPEGELYVAFMTWLPEEDEIIGKTFDVIRRRLPEWNSYSKRTDDRLPWWSRKRFIREMFHRYDIQLQFSYSAWYGRIKATAGIGDALSEDELEELNEELYATIVGDGPEEFDLLHEVVISKYRKI